MSAIHITEISRHFIAAGSSIDKAGFKKHYQVQSTSQEREIRGKISHGKFVSEWATKKY